MAILNAFHILIHKGMLECATSVTRNNFHHGWHIMDGTSFPPGITKIGTTVTPGGLGAIFGGFLRIMNFQEYVVVIAQC